MFEQVRYYHAVVECRSFSGGAERCQISQSAISQQIRKLEEELGAELVTRKKGSFSITPAGQYYYDHTKELVMQYEKACRAVAKLGGFGREELRIGLLVNYVGEEIQQGLDLFAMAFPNAQIRIQRHTHEGNHERLIDERADAIINDQRRIFSGRYHNEVLMESCLYIRVAERSPWFAKEEVDMEELGTGVCILVTSPAHRAEERGFFKNVVGLQGVFQYAATMEEAEYMLAHDPSGYIPVDISSKTAQRAETDRTYIRVLQNGKPVERRLFLCRKFSSDDVYISTLETCIKKAFSQCGQLKLFDN